MALHDGASCMRTVAHSSACSWSAPCRWRQTSSRCSSDSLFSSSSVCSVPLRCRYAECSTSNSPPCGICDDICGATLLAAVLSPSVWPPFSSCERSPASAVPTVLTCETSSASSATPPAAWHARQISIELARSRPPSSAAEAACAALGPSTGRASASVLASAGRALASTGRAVASASASAPASPTLALASASASAPALASGLASAPAMAWSSASASASSSAWPGSAWSSARSSTCSSTWFSACSSTCSSTWYSTWSLAWSSAWYSVCSSGAGGPA
mmetsp:Transcript_14241/g.33572  ORF Transcript_14241/g.33572 Transcript_14241/m.33572 type:complete len:275 (-) Transcript_14241:492-1316(-)